MKQARVILLTLCAVPVVVIAGLGYVLCRPIPSCSDEDFKQALVVISEVLHVRLVDEYLTGGDMRLFPGPVRIRQELRDVVFPPRPRGIDAHRTRIARYGIQATNGQAHVTAFISEDQIVSVEIQAFGNARLADAIEEVLKNWVPTARLPIKSRITDKPLWESEDKHAKRPPASHSPTGEATGLGLPEE